MKRRTLYDILDVDETADTDTIKKAYRKKAKETHPDHNKGKEEDFIEVNKAYAVLVCTERRRRYDETGDTNERSASSKFSEAVALIQSMLQSIVSTLNEDIIYIDIISEMQHALSMKNKEHGKEINKLQRKLALYQKVLTKLENKGKDSILENVLNDSIKTRRHMIESNHRAIEVIDISLKLIKDYKFNVDVKQNINNPFNNAQMIFMSTTSSW